MSFTDFINSFQNGINLFLNSITSFCDSLIHNYIFIVFLGLVLFISFFWFFINLVIDIFHTKVDSNIDNYIDTYNNFDKFQKIKFEWYNNNRDMVYKTRYDNFMIANNVRSMFNLNNKHEIINNNFKYNKDMSYTNPEWLYQDLIGVKPTPEEEQEMTDILNNF